MNKTKVRAIVTKELIDARKNKMIVISMALIPILLVALVLGTAIVMLNVDEPLGADEVAMIPAGLRDMDPQHAFLVIMNDQYLFYFLLIPMVLPVYIAAYSIIGEKETKSLEPLLATPISVSELLLAKSLAATVPPVILTWLCFLFLAVCGYVIMPHEVWSALVRPVWLIGMALFSPLLALLSVLSGVIVSSRLNDPRAAQQVTGIFVVPVIGMSIGVMMGRVLLSVPMVLVASLAVLVLDGLVLYFAVKLFQRETILTRWK
jgi:ABC-2 type transport system permease protein